MGIGQNNLIPTKKKQAWLWLKWILIGSVIFFILAVILFFVFVYPSGDERKNIAIPDFQDPKCTRTFKPQFNAEPYYQGPLFDTHFHIPPDHKNIFIRNFPRLQKDITLDQIVCELEKEKVIGTIGFYAPSSMLMFTSLSDDQIIKQWSDQGNDIKNGLPPWFRLLYDPIEYKNEAEKAFNTNPNAYQGFGEMVFLKNGNPRPGSKVNDEIALASYNFAGEYKKIVMVHPEPSDKNQLENALKQNPNTIFLLHGWNRQNDVVDLMDKYPNLFFTLDVTTLVYKAGKYIDSDSDKFIAQAKMDFNADLQNAIHQWERSIELHPDRFLWGTDRCLKDHYSEEFGKFYEEKARAFIGRLNPDYQEMIAYKNAQDIFEKGLQSQIKISNQNQKGDFDYLLESTRSCFIDMIGEDKWNELNNHQRPLTVQEREIIEQCRE